MIYDFFAPEDHLYITASRLRKKLCPVSRISEAVTRLFRLNRAIRAETIHFFFSTRTLKVGVYDLGKFCKQFLSFPGLIVKRVSISYVFISSVRTLAAEPCIVVPARQKARLEAFSQSRETANIKAVSLITCALPTNEGHWLRLEDVFELRDVDPFSLTLANDDEELREAVQKCEANMRKTLTAAQ